MPPDKRKPASQAAIAERLKLHRSTVRDHQRSGAIPKGSTLQEAEVAYKAHIANSPRDGLAEARARQALAYALKIERQNAKEEGRLIDGEAAGQAFAQEQAIVRAVLMSQAEEIGPGIHAAARASADPMRVIEILRAALREVCKLLADPKQPQ